MIWPLLRVCADACCKVRHQPSADRLNLGYLRCSLHANLERSMWEGRAVYMLAIVGRELRRQWHFAAMID